MLFSWYWLQFGFGIHWTLQQQQYSGFMHSQAEFDIAHSWTSQTTTVHDLGYPPGLSQSSLQLSASSVPNPRHTADSEHATTTQFQWNVHARPFRCSVKGEGSIPAVEDGGACGSQAKAHSTWPHSVPGPKHRNHVAKRSLKRAIRRAFTTGEAWYKGRLYTAPALAHHQMTPSVRCPQPPVRTRGFRVFNWNCGGLRMENWDFLQQWLRQNPYDLVCLQETHWSLTQEWQVPGYWCVHSGTSGYRGGLLTLVSKRLCHQTQISWADIIPGHLVHIRLQLTPLNYDILNCYQHASVPTHQEARRTFWHTLRDVLHRIPNRNMLCLAGDLNTTLSQVAPGIGLATYQTSDGLRRTGPLHSDRHHLHSIITDFHLSVLNSWTSSHGPTFLNQEGSSRIDYIRSRHVDEAAKITIHVHDHPLIPLTGPRHIPLCAWLRITWHHPTPPPTSGSQQMRTFLLNQWRTEPQCALNLQHHAQTALQQVTESEVRRASVSDPRQLEAEWFCPECLLTFSTQAHLRKHNTIHHETREGQLRAYQIAEARTGEPTCTRCHMHFTSWSAFKYHVQFVCTASAQDTATMDDPALQHRIELRRHLLANLHSLHLHESLCHQLTHCCCLCLRLCASDAGLLKHWSQDHPQAYTNHGKYLEDVEHQSMKATPCPYCKEDITSNHQCIVHRQLAMLIANDRPGPQTDQEHAKHWGQAAAQAFQLETLYKEDNTCYCDPQMPGKHTCVIFLQLALLQRHWSDTCDVTQEAAPEIGPAPLRPPEFEHMVKVSLKLGSVDMILQSRTVKRHLSTRCLMCNQYYASPADLLHHLDIQHPVEWNMCQPFLTLMLNTFFTTRGCTCDPQLHRGKSDHICIPLAQIAMIACRMPEIVVLPFRFASVEVMPALSTWLNPDQVTMILEWLTTRSFEQLLTAEWLHNILQTQCITCGQAFLDEDLAEHIWNYHVSISQHAAPVMILISHALADLLPEPFCPLCNLALDDDTTQAMIQLGVLLSLPNQQHPPYACQWPPAAQCRQQVHRRQLTLTDGMATVLDPSDTNLIQTWHKLVQHLFVEPLLLQSIMVDPHHAPACLAHLAQTAQTAEQCTLCGVQHRSEPCPILLQLATVLTDGIGPHRPEHAQCGRRDHGVLETHHSTFSVEESPGRVKRQRRATSEETAKDLTDPQEVSGTTSPNPTVADPAHEVGGPSRGLAECDPLRTAISDSLRSGRSGNPSATLRCDLQMAQHHGPHHATSPSLGPADHPVDDRTPGTPDEARINYGQGNGSQAKPLHGGREDALSSLGCEEPEADPKHQDDASFPGHGAEGVAIPLDRHAEPSSDLEIPLPEETIGAADGTAVDTLDVDSVDGPGNHDERSATEALLACCLASYRCPVQASNTGEVPDSQGPAGSYHASPAATPTSCIRILKNPNATCCFANAPLLGLTWQSLLMDGWERGQQLFRKLTTLTPHQLYLVDDPDFIAAFRGHWEEFSHQYDAIEFTTSMLEALQPKLLSNSWTTQQEFLGLGRDTDLESLKNPDLAPVQLNVFSQAAHATSHCTLAALISAWHDATGYPKGLLQKSPSVVLSLPRTHDDAISTNPLQILECEQDFTMPFFSDSQGTIEHQSYTPMALTYHLGATARRGHFRSALRMAHGWKSYEDGRVPDHWIRPRIPAHGQIVLIWAIRTDLWLDIVPNMNDAIMHAAMSSATNFE
eukprot:Skav210622  [mRNA]  locus=scaffold234:513616:521032:- [translate_table: standard]